MDRNNAYNFPDSLFDDSKINIIRFPVDTEDIDYYEEIPRGVRAVLLNLGVIYHFILGSGYFFIQKGNLEKSNQGIQSFNDPLNKN